jgi:hypothetical protein
MIFGRAIRRVDKHPEAMRDPPVRRSIVWLMPVLKKIYFSCCSHRNRQIPCKSPFPSIPLKLPILRSFLQRLASRCFPDSASWSAIRSDKKRQTDGFRFAVSGMRSVACPDGQIEKRAGPRWIRNDDDTVPASVSPLRRSVADLFQPGPRCGPRSAAASSADMLTPRLAATSFARRDRETRLMNRCNFYLALVQRAEVGHLFEPAFLPLLLNVDLRHPVPTRTVCCCKRSSLAFITGAHEIISPVTILGGNRR